MAFLHKIYFPRVAFGPIPLSPDKSQFFMSSIETVGFQVSRGKILAAAKHHEKFARWAEEWARRPPRTWEETQQLVFMTLFLRKHIPGRVDFVRRLKSAFYDVVGTETPTGRKSVVTKWRLKEEPTWGPILSTYSDAKEREGEKRERERTCGPIVPS